MFVKYKLISRIFSIICTYFYKKFVKKENCNCINCKKIQLEALYFWHIRIHRVDELISINFKVQISLNNTEIINTRNLNKVRIQNSQSAFELSIYWTLSTINVTRIVTGTLLWLIRILNKIHNSLICIVFNVFCSFPRNHISLSFDWRDLEWNCPEF